MLYILILSYPKPNLNSSIYPVHTWTLNSQHTRWLSDKKLPGSSKLPLKSFKTQSEYHLLIQSSPRILGRVPKHLPVTSSKMFTWCLSPTSSQGQQSPSSADLSDSKVPMSRGRIILVNTRAAVPTVNNTEITEWKQYYVFNWRINWLWNQTQVFLTYISITY